MLTCSAPLAPCFLFCPPAEIAPSVPEAYFASAEQTGHPPDPRMGLCPPRYRQSLSSEYPVSNVPRTDRAEASRAGHRFGGLLLPTLMHFCQIFRGGSADVAKGNTALSGGTARYQLTIRLFGDMVIGEDGVSLLSIGSYPPYTNPVGDRQCNTRYWVSLLRHAICTR